MKFFFDDGDQDVGGHGTPDLRLHRVLAGCQKSLDAQVLLDPLEKQLDLPTALVQGGDGQGRQRHIVGQEDQGLARRRVFESHPAQMLWIVLADIKAIQSDALIANHTGGPVCGARVHPPGVHAAFGAGYEKRAALVKLEQPRKIQITAIHDVERARLDRQDIEHVDVPQLAVADMDESGNRPSQVQERVHLHGRLG